MKTITVLIFLSSFIVNAAPLFENSSILELELSYDISRLQREKENLREEGLVGTLKDKSNNNLYSVEVLSRGGGSFMCQQPQLKIKFNKKNVKNTIFSKLKKVKLFTKGTCLENITDTEQDKQVLANYLIYKLYEEITEFSFKTRLLKIDYIDTSGNYDNYTQYAFFLEPKRNLEKRLDLTYVDYLETQEIGSQIPVLINSDILAKVNAFELMIANYDYGIPGFFSHIIYDSGYPDLFYMEKNSKLYKKTSGELIPFIYDFDFSRFGYDGPMCRFSFNFFMNDNVYNPNCDHESLSLSLENDLAKFRYADDFYLNLEALSISLNTWSNKYKLLIEELGPEYSLGLKNFKEVMNNKLLEQIEI